MMTIVYILIALWLLKGLVEILWGLTEIALGILLLVAGGLWKAIRAAGRGIKALALVALGK
jgi:hypothetical protein